MQSLRTLQALIGGAATLGTVQVVSLDTLVPLGLVVLGGGLLWRVSALIHRVNDRLSNLERRINGLDRRRESRAVGGDR